MIDVRLFLARAASVDDLRTVLPCDVEIVFGEPTLEDAFVHHAGRSLGDDDAESDAA